MDEIITTCNLTKTYGAFKGAKEVTAIKDITLNIKKGDFVGVMGPSGSGKTTLLNILSGLDQATSGDIRIGKSDVTKMSKDELILYRRKHIGYIFQDFNLMDSLTVKENIALPLILDRISPKVIDQKVRELMEFFAIEELTDKYPYHISGGQKQRVAAARALIHNPVVCFADEPTGNLDSKSSANVMNMLTTINKEKMATILMVTHDAFAASYCKRIIFIKDGEIHFEIQSNGDRKQFFDKILEAQSILGGE